MPLRIILISLSVLSVLIVGSVIIFEEQSLPTPPPPPSPSLATTTTLPNEEVPRPLHEAIGLSVEGRPIVRYTFGTGSTTLLFVGGMHGGYEWNSSALAYEFISALERNEIAIPSTLTIVIVPTLNPDGLFRTTGIEGRFTAAEVPTSITYDGTGRFNANDVDLNRNFDCKWQPTSSWRDRVVSAGTEPFSEPEAATLRALVTELAPAAVTFWHSQSDAVYASECEAGILSDTLTLMNTYANASGYRAIDRFDAYAVSGDAEGWLASIGIPAITVELASRTSTEWERNRPAFVALLDLYHTK